MRRRCCQWFLFHLPSARTSRCSVRRAAPSARAHPGALGGACQCPRFPPLRRGRRGSRVRGPLWVGGGGSSALAGAVSRDAQTTDVSTATPQPRTSRTGRLSKRGRGLPQTAPEPPYIRPSSRWVALSFGACDAVSYCSRVLHLTLA